MDRIDNLKLSKEEILAVLAVIITEVIGDAFMFKIGEIKTSSSFASDLELDSIEIVEFSEKVKSHYGDKINFHTWLSTMDMEQIFRLTVGDVVKHIEECLN